MDLLSKQIIPPQVRFDPRDLCRTVQALRQALRPRHLWPPSGGEIQRRTCMLSPSPYGSFSFASDAKAQYVAVNLFSLHFVGPRIVRWLVPDLSLPANRA